MEPERGSGRAAAPQSFVDLPEPLTTLLIEAAQQGEPLQVDHVEEDPRLGAEEAREIVEALGVRSLAAVPVAMGDEVVGWTMVQSVVSRPVGTARAGDLCRLSHDLVSSLMQVRAFEQQRESMHRLQELHRAKDSFIATVSHELRTPLTSIVGYLEVMGDGAMGPLPKGVSAGLSVIERNAVGSQPRRGPPHPVRVRRRRRPARPAAPQPRRPGRVSACRSLIPLALDQDIDLRIVAERGLPAVLADREPHRAGGRATWSATR